MRTGLVISIRLLRRMKMMRMTKFRAWLLVGNLGIVIFLGVGKGNLKELKIKKSQF